MNTNIKELLIEASTLVGELIEEEKIPKDLRDVAFTKTIDILYQGASISSTNDTQNNAFSTSKSQPNRGGNDTPLSQLADSLEVSLEQVKEVFDFDGEHLELIISPRQLDKSTAGAMKEIALLVTVARQYSNLEEWTPISEVREACINLGPFDAPNFSKAITSINSLRFKGSGQKRELKAPRSALEEAKDLVRRLSSGEES